MLEQMLDKEFETKPVKEVIKASPAALQGISDAGAEALKKYLGISSIEDMASNKYFLWAQAMTTVASTIK
ncbi:MAG: hypothetical protein HQL39_18890 [Alphaproteobacteria bacterium]|nr:hypothetical protein [Alphaproteobacteria bacterium]